MNLIAHRGYSDLAPENTYSSFDLAISKGFKIFELDVQLTKDNIPIIFHDYDLKRIFNLDLLIKNTEYEFLSKLDAGSWFDKKYFDQKIPTFENILKKYKNQVHLQIELKSHEKDLANIVINKLKKMDWYNIASKPYEVPGYSITSFDFNNLINVRELSKNIRVGWLLSIERENIESVKKKLVEYDINMIIPNVNDEIWSNNNLIKQFKDEGYLLCAWGAKSIIDVENMNQIDIDGMTVDWPEKAFKAIL